MTKKEIGIFIFQERKKQKLSQKQLAEKANISRYQQIIELEKAQFDSGIDCILKVITALGFELIVNDPTWEQRVNAEVTEPSIPSNPFDFSKVETAKEEEPDVKTFPGTKNAPTPFKRKQKAKL